MSPRLLARALVSAAVVLAAAAPAGGSGAPGRLLDGLELYDAGGAVGGHPLSAVLRRDTPMPYVAFVYGDCSPSGDTGCAPPAEVQVWPACRRNLALYRASEHGVGPPLEQATVRGAPAAFLDAGTRLELQTGRVTVVVFARSRAEVERVAAALRAVDGSVAPGRPLPPPSPGALGGEAPC